MKNELRMQAFAAGGSIDSHTSERRTGRSRSSRGRGDVDAETIRRAVRRALRTALWMWPPFAAVDVYMVAALYPHASTWRPFLMRLAVEAAVLWAHQFATRRDVPVRLLLAAYNACFATAALSIAVMALDFGGLTSSYMHGLSLVVLVRTALVPAPFRVALLASVPVVLMYPAVMGIAAVFSPFLRASWLDPSTLLTALAQYIWVPATGVIGALSSHVVWGAQQQVYQARKLGRYRLEAPIGKGGMSEVWLAWDETLQRNVALKLLRTRDVPDPAVVRRFEQEAHAASKLSDPHTIRIFDFGASDDGIYYIAMEHLRGADLALIVRNYGPMPTARAVRFAVQACRSLIEAHEAGVIHRDIKPQNLFITRVGDDHDFLKLLDFGVARVLDGEKDLQLTGSGMLCGTPAYMAPEVCRGERADARSDLYALGGTLYFLLTGELPFQGSSSGQLFMMHMVQPALPPSARRGRAVPPEVDAIVLKCLAKDPRQRFQSARELMDALLPLVDDHAWNAADADHFWRYHRAAELGQIDEQNEPTEDDGGDNTTNIH